MARSDYTHKMINGELVELTEVEIDEFVKREEEFKVGQSNPTFILTGKKNRLVLRKKPSGKLLKSAHMIEREYKVRVHGKVDVKKIESIEKGVTIDGINYSAIKISQGKKMNTNSWLSVVLREGKNREIRKICNYINLNVNRLLRVAYGPFKLNDMKRGELKEVPEIFLRKNFKSHFQL